MADNNTLREYCTFCLLCIYHKLPMSAIKVAGKQINFCACSKQPFPEWHSTEPDSS